MPLRALPLAAALLLAATPLGAQTLQVTVRDASTGAPVEDALVRVEDVRGALVRMAFSPRGGGLRVALPAPGEYRVEVRRAAYGPAEARVRVAAEGGSVEIALAPRPLALDTVRVVAPSPDERGRDAFDRRRATLSGVFLDPEYLSQRWGVRYIEQMLADAPGMVIDVEPRTGRRIAKSVRGHRCLTMLLDGRPPRLGTFRTPEFAHDNLDFWFRAPDIVGVEIYHHHSEIPREYRRYSEPRCGMVIYWTRAGW